MNQFYIKIQDEYLIRYKLVEHGSFRLFLCITQEEANVFDEDDLIIKLLKEKWFPNQVELILAGKSLDAPLEEIVGYTTPDDLNDQWDWNW